MHSNFYAKTNISKAFEYERAYLRCDMRKISLKYQFLCSLLHLSRRALNYLSTQYNYQFTRGLESRIKMIDQHHSIWKTTNWTKIKDYNFWSVFGAKIELLCLRFQGWVRLIELGLDKFKMMLNFRTKYTFETVAKNLIWILLQENKSSF